MTTVFDSFSLGRITLNKRLVMAPKTRSRANEDRTPSPHAATYFGLAYLHLMHQGNEALLTDIRHIWKGCLIFNRPGRSRDNVGIDVKSGLADLESYGAMTLANPDFVERLRVNAPMNEPHREEYFCGGETFYIDYPTLGELKNS